MKNQKNIERKIDIREKIKFTLFLISICIILMLLSLCSCGKYCISTNIEKYGVTGEICYDSAQSKLEGNFVFVDSEGNKIIGIDETDIKDILKIIESGKKIIDYGKEFFNLSTQEFASERLQRILQEYKRNNKDYKNGN